MKLTPVKVILLGALLIAASCLSSCSKQYEAPVFWDIKIKQTIAPATLSLEAIAYPNTGVTYKWTVNGVNYTGKVIEVGYAARYEIQLTVILDKDNSKAEYLTITRL